MSQKRKGFLYFTYPTANQIGFPWTSVAEIPETVKEHLTSTIDKDGYYYGIFNEIVFNSLAVKEA